MAQEVPQLIRDLLRIETFKYRLIFIERVPWQEHDIPERINTPLNPPDFKVGHERERLIRKFILIAVFETIGLQALVWF